MYHPAYILRGDLADQPTAEQDLRRLREIIEFGGVPEELALRPTVVDTWPKVEAMLDALEGIVSFDLEGDEAYIPRRVSFVSCPTYFTLAQGDI